jgi:hypothetical protein
MREMPLVSTETKSILRSESDRRENRKLVRRVDAVDVEGGIGLGIAQRLRFGEHVGEVAPCLSIVVRM